MTKAKLQKIHSNYESNDNKHRFYDRVIRLSSNLSNRPFRRRTPPQDWSVYKTEEEYEESLKSAAAFSEKFTDAQKESIDTIIYNNNADGVFSAYIAWKYLSNKGKKDIQLIQLAPDFRARNLSDKIKNIENKISGKNVLMVDLSYNKETIEHIKNITNFFIDLDNHDSPELSDLDYVFITKNKTSNNIKIKKGHGTIAAAWKFFHPKEKVPYIFQTIDSADVKLYLKYLPEPDPIMMALDVTFVKNQSKKYYGNEKQLFEDIDNFLNESEDVKILNFISILGHVMERFAENMKMEVVRNAAEKTLKTPDGKTYPIVVLNYAQPGLTKRVAKNMAMKNPGRLAVIWYYNFKSNAIDMSISTNHIPGVQNPLSEIKQGFRQGGFEGDTYHVILSGPPGDISKYII